VTASADMAKHVIGSFLKARAVVIDSTGNKRKKEKKFEIRNSDPSCPPLMEEGGQAYGI
jgi:hypothetical protein